jgi:NADH-quinone oxidoreductase subunit G
MVASLKKLGFDYVFDTNFTADLTILEEGTELIGRVKNGGPFPMFTSCCPAWVNLVEKQYPEFTANLSTCKSPQGMLGSVIKNVFAKRINVDPLKVKVVSVMPCTAKKDECAREGLTSTFANAKGETVTVPDVDYVLTTRELGDLIKMNRIPFASLPDMEFDTPLGEGTGAAVIFGASGGVEEAALRTVFEVVTGQKLENVEFKSLRGYEGIREATIPVGALNVNVAVASGLKHAHQIMKMIKDGTKQYHFVEVMACPGGCIQGGGQPKITTQGVLECRNASTYAIDANNEHRKSHENKSVTDIYAKYFDKPNSHRAHELLHTHYHDRKNKH